MKTILLSLTLAITNLIVTAQSTTSSETVAKSEGTTITVTVSVHTTGGHVLFGLHDESTFMKEPLEGASGDIIDGKSTITFKNIAPGTYGVLVVHDKNDNKRMDFEPSGMPKESFGMSNNPMSYGPPQWSEAKFEVADQPVEIDIRL